MIIVGAVAAVLVVGTLAAWFVSRTDVGGVEPAVTTESAAPLPAGPVVAEDVLDVRFDQALRGYRMEQVDAVVDRLADELAARDREIALLRAERGEGV